jgi:hypothetical protein
MAAGRTFHGLTSLFLELDNGRPIVFEGGDFDVIRMGGHRFEKILPGELLNNLPHFRFRQPHGQPIPQRRHCEWPTMGIGDHGLDFR